MNMSIASRFLGAAALLFSANAVCAQQPSLHTYFTGPYVGGAVGGEIARTKFDFAAAGSETDNQVSPVVRLFFGYGYEYESAYVGFELGAGYSRPHTRAGDVEMRAGVDPSLDLRVGFTPTRYALIYSRIGASLRDTKLSGIDEDSGLTPGLRLGIGADYLVTKNAFLRAEVTSSIYGDLSVNSTRGAAEGSLATYGMTVGVGYKF